MPGSKAEKLRKAYEFKLGKSLVSKLSDDQINLLSKFYNSLSESEQSDIDNKIFKGHTDTDLHEMAEGFYQEQIEKKIADEQSKARIKEILEKKKAKETPKETTKSSAIVPSNFFGKDRYEKYLEEINAQGTIEGHQLTSQERKEAFKSRKNKINFQNFVEKVLEKKVAAASVSNINVSTSLMGGGALATAESIKNTVNQSVSTGEDYTEILGKIDEIIDVLKKEQKLKEKIENTKRKEKEKRKRKGAESNLEKGFKAAKKAVEKVVAPVKGILDRIITFLLTVLMGRAVVKLIDWFSDKKNKSKVDSIFRFLGDNWPKLLALFLVFKTGLGKFARGLIRLIIRGTARLVAATATLLAKTVGGKIGGKLGKFGKFLGGKKGKLLTAGLEIAAVTGGTMLLGDQIENVLKFDSPPKEGTETKTKTQNYKGGGPVFPQFKMPSFLHLFKGSEYGGDEEKQSSEKPQGYVSGEKGVDKIPAMLSDGEFVMSPGAVERYGVDTLESMNAAGGGDNKPKIKSGKIFAAGGGAINTALHHLKKDESLSSLTRGKNDHIKPGGMSVVSNTNWSSITPSTPIYAYHTGLSGDRPTIGWGSTFYDSIFNGKKPVSPGDQITKSKADIVLKENVINIYKEYNKKIPLFKHFSENQKAGLLLLGYNAPYGPIGAYKNLTKALSDGNMVAAANNIYRGGPNKERIELEKSLILSGPPVVKGPKIVGPKIVGEEKVGSGIPFVPDLTIKNWWNNMTGQGSNNNNKNNQSSGGKPKPYFSGGLIQAREADNPYNIRWPRDYYPGKKAPPGPGYVPPVKLASNTRSQKGLPSIPPPMSSNVQVEYVPIDAMKGNLPPVAASSYGGSDIPSFSASAPGPDYKRQTLGITQ